MTRSALQDFGRDFLTNLRTNVLSENPIGRAQLQREQQQAALSQIGQVLGGDFAASRPGMSPQDIQRQRGLALLQIANPQAQQLGAEIFRNTLQNPELDLRRQREQRLQEEQAFRQNLLQQALQPTPDASGQAQMPATDERLTRARALLLDPSTAALGRSLIEEITTEEQREFERTRKPKTPEQAAKISLQKRAIENIDKAKNILFDDEGDFNDRFLINTFTGKGRTAKTLIKGAVEAQLRAESGAAVTESEVERATERFFPSLLDSDELKSEKLNNLRNLLSGSLSVSGVDLESDQDIPINEAPVINNIRTRATEILQRRLRGQ